MSYCLNPECAHPQNPVGTIFCVTCGKKLLLKERYRAIKPIGQGGFGRTFLAVDEDKPSKPPCVIKQFFPQAQGTKTVQKAIELFNQEAMRLEELGKHPQIPDLLAHFSQDDRQYLVQEFIDGQNLGQELAQFGVFDEIKIRQLLSNLLSVLQFIHDKQIIHRDIKPENIIRKNSDNQLFLVDFGAAKVMIGEAILQPGTSIGSPEYVAPEQIRGQAIFSSDIYSLGVTCIHLLTQKSPFDLYDLNQDKWFWRQFLTSVISDSLGEILDKMLASTPSNRYQSAAEVLKDFNTVNGSNTTSLQTAVKVSLAPPQSSATVTTATTAATSKSLIDLELAALKAELSENAPLKSQSQVENELALMKAQIPNSSKFQSQIDLELAELKSQFYNNPNA